MGNIEFDFTQEETTIFIISAPSGVGKTTIRNELISSVSDLHYSVSYSTRVPRYGELDGQDYYFITQELFQKKIKDNFFLEWAQVHDNYYGTGKEPFYEALREKKDLLLDIDVQGAHALQMRLKGAISIFLLPPSWEVLEDRLRNRQTETEEQIQQRLINARKEIHRCHEYDYIIVNSNLEETVQKIHSIILTEHCRPSKMKRALQKIW